MPRPTAQTENLSEPLEAAAGALEIVAGSISPTTLLRLEQAVRRHPDLQTLLEPAGEEIAEMVRRARVAGEQVRKVIGMVWEKR